jgi:hypothetical protein
MGYTPLLLPNPVNISAIENEHFRTQIDKTGVAGSSELIKLYLYTLTDHPIVVHWDIDVIVLVSTVYIVLLLSLSFDATCYMPHATDSAGRISPCLHPCFSFLYCYNLLAFDGFLLETHG